MPPNDMLFRLLYRTGCFSGYILSISLRQSLCPNLVYFGLFFSFVSPGIGYLQAVVSLKILFPLQRICLTSVSPMSRIELGQAIYM